MILICLTNSCGKVKIIFYISLYITKFHYHNDTIVMFFRSETNNPNNCKMHYVDWSGNGQPPGHMLYDPFEEEAALLFGNHHHICPEMKKALQGVFLIAEQKKRIEESTKVSNKHFQFSVEQLLGRSLIRKSCHQCTSIHSFFDQLFKARRCRDRYPTSWV